jgi:hypothetical protein
MTPIITISSRVPHEPYYFYREFLWSAKRQKIDPIFIPCFPYRGLMSKPKFLLKYLYSMPDRPKHVIVCDAWDIIFLTGSEEIMYNYKGFGLPIVFNSEQNCFPRADLAEMFPESVTPYRYLNSGFFVGETDAVIAMLEAMKLDTIPDDTQLPNGSWDCKNDQEFYMIQFLDDRRNNRQRSTLDTTGILCQSLHGSAADEFAFRPDTGRVVSLLTKNQPCAVHGNGGGKDWLKKIILWLNLS